MKSNARLALASACIAIAALSSVGLAGCATTSPTLQIQENERLATVYQQKGSPELSRLYQDRADQARSEEKRKNHSFWDAFLEALFSISID
jgi:hypothetical protein